MYLFIYSAVQEIGKFRADRLFSHQTLVKWPLPTVGEWKDWTKRNLWSKTTLNTGGIGILPLVKWGHFFMSLTLTEPSLNNFQSNGGKWPRLSLWKKIYKGVFNWISVIYSLTVWIQQSGLKISDCISLFFSQNHLKSGVDPKLFLLTKIQIDAHRL